MQFAIDQFRKVFGQAPEAVAEAPGRINLIGEHVDYLGGCVLPAAIDRRITMAASPGRGTEIRIWSGGHTASPVAIDRTCLEPLRDARAQWLNYIVGVLAGYRDAGADVPAFDATLVSDLPAGAGLSSSAALETAVALAFEALSGFQLDVLARARLCQQAEHRFAGVPCGIMDQLAVGAGVSGHATLIDCRDLDCKPVPIPAGVAIVVAETGVRHALGDGEYRARREECEEACRILGAESLRDVPPGDVDRLRDSLGDRLHRRAKHAVTEMARVTDFVHALESGEVTPIGPLMRAGHDSLRDDFEVSCEELDLLVDAAYAFGADRGLLGSRMTGAGFGGSTVSLVREEATEAFQTAIAGAFRSRFGRSCETFVTSAAEGARILTT